MEASGVVQVQGPLGQSTRGPGGGSAGGPGGGSAGSPGCWRSIGDQLVRVPGVLGAAVQEVQVVLECFMGLVINGLSDQRVLHKWSEWLE